ncbi:hypothetical protein BC941DRAFT_383937, partial [Chlamydoabsidia padenii]
MVRRSRSSHFPVDAVQLTAYADDILVFCANLADFNNLHAIYDLYGLASNAKLNSSKSVAFMLTGKSPPLYISSHLQQHHISTWYNHMDPLPLMYLGFPILYTTTQRNLLFDQLLTKIQSAFQIHGIRSLSILGRATITNILILSTLWHALRLCTLPIKYFSRIRGLVSTFVSGGLGLLDPQLQHKALQLRLLRQLMQPFPSLSPMLRPISS